MYLYKYAYTYRPIDFNYSIFIEDYKQLKRKELVYERDIHILNNQIISMKME